MKKNKLTNHEVLAYNLAVKRDDGKIEQDTVYRDKFFTLEEVKAIAEKFKCEVMVSFVGVLRYANEKIAKENSFFVSLNAPIDATGQQES